MSECIICGKQNYHSGPLCKECDLESRKYYNRNLIDSGRFDEFKNRRLQQIKKMGDPPDCLENNDE